MTTHLPALRRATQLLGFAALTTLVTLATGCSVILARETRVTTVPHQPATAIRVETRNGGVTLRKAAREDVEITAKLAATTPERLAQAQVVAERQPDGALLVKVNWPDRPRSREGCAFDIALPEAVGVAIDTSNGGIEIADLAGTAQLDSSNGAIRVSNHAGDVHADTSNGAITLRNIAGSVHADSSNGRVVLRGVAGKATVDTSNGGVEIELADHAAGPLDVDTSNGHVEIRLGTAFTGELQLSTSNGRIQLDAAGATRVKQSGRGDATLTFGSDATRSRVRTSNGGIRVTQSAAARTASDPQ